MSFTKHSTKKGRRQTKKSRRQTKKRNTKNRRINIHNNLGKGLSPSPISPNETIPCCMCGHKDHRNNMLIPSDCLLKQAKKNQGERAHRVCQQCWWGTTENPGFVKEDASHKCPGCQKGLPLLPPLKRSRPKEEDIIVISD